MGEPPLCGTKLVWKEWEGWGWWWFYALITKKHKQSKVNNTFSIHEAREKEENRKEGRERARERERGGHAFLCKA